MSVAGPLRVGAVAVHPSSNEIDAGAGRQRIPPRLMALLVRLARDPGAPVSRETLLTEVWSRRGVSDEVLSRAVADLRTALGDDAKEPRYIETLPKVGYRLVAPVSPLEAAAATPAKPPASASLLAILGRRRRPGPVAKATLAALTLAVVAWTAWNPVPDTAHAWQTQVAASMVLAAGDDYEVAPRFSPDGRRIAYAVGDRTSRIVVEDVATRERRTLGDAGAIATSPVFFPGGERVAYLRSAGESCTLVEAAIDGSHARTIAPCPAGMRERFDLAPDGRTIVAAATRKPDMPAGLFALDVATGAIAWLTTPEPGQGDDVQPRVSPDGKRVAFFRGAVARRELWLLDLATRAAKRVGRQSGLAYGLAFAPRGDAVIVATDWSGVRALERVDLEHGTNVLVGGRGARFPDVSRGGDVVYEWANYRANLWRVDAREPAPAWPAARYSSQVEVSPDGKRVAFVSNRDGVEAIYVADVGGGDAKRVGSGDGFRTIRPRWSADSRSIVAVRTPRGDPASVSTAVRIDADSGAAVPLAALGERVHGVVPAPDGSLVVGEQVGHAVRLARASADGRDAERLPLPLVAEYRVAGAWLVFTQPQLPGFTACTWPALACRPLGVAFDDPARQDWTLARDALWRIVESDGVALVRVDVATGRETARIALAGPPSVTSVGAGPGGVPLYVAREERTQVDLMIARR